MKIKKKAKLPRLECDLCGCVFVPSKDDLKLRFRNDASYTDDKKKIKDDVYVNCPTCSLSKLVFEEGATDGKSDL
jgi:rubredoxin